MAHKPLSPEERHELRGKFVSRLCSLMAANKAAVMAVYCSLSAGMARSALMSLFLPDVQIDKEARSRALLKMPTGWAHDIASVIKSIDPQMWEDFKHLTGGDFEDCARQALDHYNRNHAQELM